MKGVIIQGVPMIPASEVYAELERLTASRIFWRQAAAANGTRANDYEAQLDAIREALHGEPDCDLVALAAATYAASLQFAPYVRLGGTVPNSPQEVRAVGSGGTRWYSDEK